LHESDVWGWWLLIQVYAVVCDDQGKHVKLMLLPGTSTQAIQEVTGYSVMHD